MSSSKPRVRKKIRNLKDSKLRKIRYRLSYMCVIFDKSFRSTSLMEIGNKLQFLNKQEKINTQIVR